MSENSLIRLILDSVLKEAMGLNISSIGSNSIKHAISRRMRALEMDNTFQYLALIKKSPPELNELIEEVAVNETWFFRDEAPFGALRDYATAYFRQGRGTMLRLLSIPCSTGEEPYSMAITLIEAGIPAHAFTIDAVDISRRSLDVARQGLYRPHSFRSLYAKRYQSYFNKTRHGFALDKSIKGLVRFHRGNLLHLTAPLTKASYHVIFCRNLLIYLDASFHQHAIKTFDALLDDSGVLFIGHAEAGIFSNSNFCPAPYPKAFALQKRLVEAEGAEYPGPHTADSSRQPDPATHPHGANSANSLPPAPLFPQPESGGLDQRIRQYEDLIRHDGPTAEAFYQLATLFEQKNEWKTAIGMLKKAVYLDPNSIAAIDMLAAIYQRLGDEANYQACLNRGRRILNRLSMPDHETIE